jgi:hypothetical protein
MTDMTQRSKMRLGTEEGLQKAFGSGNLLIGSLVNPTGVRVPNAARVLSEAERTSDDAKTDEHVPQRRTSADAT